MADAYRRLFASPEITLYPITSAILWEAATLRVRHGLRTPDAIFTATAQLHPQAMFLTNDRKLATISGLPVVLLDEVLAS